MSSHPNIDSALKEQRVFEPPDEFRSKAHIQTEFGFDVVQVAKKRYTSDAYH